MKLGIHDGTALNRMSIEYCKMNGIPFVVLNAYASDIIAVAKKERITHFFWHFHHILPEDILMARDVLFSMKKMGIKVYPDFDTSWYFDDKVAEKYILEAIGAPVVPSWPFYHKQDAFDWLKNEARFPLVAKLRRGAGSYNVILLKNYTQARKYCKKMFSKGINPAPKLLADVSTKFVVAKRNRNIFLRLKKFPRFFKYMMNARNYFPKEKGYVYFQEFISGAVCDYRVVVVGDRAWGSRRDVRKNDFRASGAGQSYEDPNLIPIELVKIAVDCTKKLEAQSMAYDFVIDQQGKPFIVEISYCFGFDGGDGTFFWDKNFEVKYENFALEQLLISNLLKM